MQETKINSFAKKGVLYNHCGRLKNKKTLSLRNNVRHNNEKSTRLISVADFFFHAVVSLLHAFDHV